MNTSPENRSVMERINENLYNTYAQKISSNLNISNEQLKLDMEEVTWLQQTVQVF